MKILIAEDNLIFANTLELIIDELGYELVGVANNANDLFRLHLAMEPDILLLDIQLNGTKDGIDIAHQIMDSKHPVPIIFMTSTQDNATFERAKATNPFAYLIKPFDALLLQRTIELAFYKYEKGLWEEENFVGWEKDMVVKDSLFVKVEQHLEKVMIQDIMYIDVLTKHTNIYTAKQEYSLRMSLKELYAKLPAGVFMQINRYMLINVNYIEKVDLLDLRIKIAGKFYPISRNYKDYVLGRLNIV
ncbi:MAG: DNA-binding response regulator, partial [Bacteroidetes bacterium]